MEEKIIEQPTLDTEEIASNNPSTSQDGSILGRFKDAQSLLDAYNHLQAEFTRKSQKLAEFQRENSKSAVFELENNNESLLEDQTTDNDKYKKEIAEILSKNNFDNLPNKHHVAFNIAKTIEEKVAENLNNSQFVENYIENNPELKHKIIGEYLSSLNNISPAPKVISGNPSTIHYSNTTSSPRTLKEAGEIFSKMLK